MKSALLQEKPVSCQRVRGMELRILVKKAQAGEEEALEEICRRFGGLVKKYAFQAHVRSIAQEAEGQGWLEVMQGIRSYDEKSGVPFAGYLESRVKYGIWNLFKRERRRWEQEIQLTSGGQEEEGLSLLDKVADATDVGGEVEGQWLAQELRAAVALLPAKQRLVIGRTVLGEEGLTAVATQLGITPQGVYNLRQRGLASLKKSCAGMY